MNKFNLTFGGDIIPGKDPEQVKARFAELFFIDDPERLERFFSGATIILRRNLDRNAAAQYYLKIRDLGAIATLVKVGPPQQKTPQTTQSSDTLIKQDDGQIDKTWATSASNLTRKKQKSKRQEAAEKTSKSQTVALVRQLREARGAARLKRNVDVKSVPLKPQTQQRRQPGEPNIFKLKPFSNTAAVRQRGASARIFMHFSYAAVVLACAAFLMVGARYLSLPPAYVVSGADAVAIDPRLNLLIFADNKLLLHNRAGLGTKVVDLNSLGLAAAAAPMVFIDENQLLLRGVKHSAGKAYTAKSLLLCDLQNASCKPFSKQLGTLSTAGVEIHQATGWILIADPGASKIYKFAADGNLIDQIDTPVPRKATLRLQAGLLHMNSTSAPAISVFRPDEGAFGDQLDEILLMPPLAVELEHNTVGDFVWSQEAWWVALYNKSSGSAGVYRFDRQWNFLNQANLQAGSFPDQIIAWGNKTLVRDSSLIGLQRFNADGVAEAPVESTLLFDIAQGQQQLTSQTDSFWRLGLTGFAVLAILGWLLAQVFSLRSKVYKHQRNRSAEPIDTSNGIIRWLRPHAHRDKRYHRIIIVYITTATLLVLSAIFSEIPSMHLNALMVALAGPAIAWYLLYSTPAGHIGMQNQRLLLVDHNNNYNFGSGSRIQYRGSFIFVDDIAVFCGNVLLPAFNINQLDTIVFPATRAGIKIDRKTLWVKLLQSGHAAARGVTLILLTGITALAMLVQ